MFLGGVPLPRCLVWRAWILDDNSAQGSVMDIKYLGLDLSAVIIHPCIPSRASVIAGAGHSVQFWLCTSQDINKNTVGRLFSFYFIVTEVNLRHGAEAAIETKTVAMD